MTQQFSKSGVHECSCFFMTLKSTPTRSAAASTASKSASASSTRAIKASMAEGAEEVACDKVWMPGALCLATQSFLWWVMEFAKPVGHRAGQWWLVDGRWSLGACGFL